jgi:hypothetical protein
MATKNNIQRILSLVPLFLIITSCAGAAEPTTVPTVAPTDTAQAVQIEIIPSEVVVGKILVGQPDVDTGEIEVVVQGQASNTCTTVEGVTVSRDGEVFNLTVEAAFSSGEACVRKTVPFEETVTVSMNGLPPGTYLFTSGALASMVLEGAPEEPGETTTAGEGDEGEAETGEETGTEEVAEGSIPEEQPGAEEETAETEPRDCEDLASFVADVTYPDNTIVQAGETITKTWEIRNQGDCTWGAGYALKFASGSFSEASSLSDPFPEAAPTESIEVSVMLTVPESAGTHSGVWVIQRPEGDNVEVQAGKAFDLWAIVKVAGGTTGTGGSDETKVRKDGVVCAQSNSVYDGQLLLLINKARADNGLLAYEVQSQLMSAAWALTEDMACNNFVAHTGSDGSDWFDRITSQGYTYRDAAENIVFGYGTVPELAFNWWMDSAIHRGNILNSDLTHIGIAYALNPQTGGSYYTLVFAVPEE